MLFKNHPALAIAIAFAIYAATGLFFEKNRRLRKNFEERFILPLIMALAITGIVVGAINRFFLLPTANAWEIDGSIMKPLDSLRLRNPEARIFFFESDPSTRWETPRMVAWTKIEKFGTGYQFSERTYWVATEVNKERFLRYVAMNPGFSDQTEREYVTKFNTYWWTRFLDEHPGILAAHEAADIEKTAQAWLDQCFPERVVSISGIVTGGRYFPADLPKPVL